jgi:uncharacterized protein (DUF433 family)
MDNALLLSYQIEYETTNISKEELVDKYNITPKDLKGSEHWAKRNESSYLVETPSQAIVLAATKETNEDLMADIDKFKREVVAKALDFIKNHAQYAEVKELKDMVAIVDSVEKSYKDTNTGPTINVLVQNLTENFKDDC